MFLNNINEFSEKSLLNFSERPSSVLNEWEQAFSTILCEKIDWATIDCWMVSFIILSMTLLILFCKSHIAEWLSKHILSSAFLIWFLGVVVYIIGYYREDINGLYVVPSAIISSFRMFVVSHDMSRISSFIKNDSLYMAIFSLVHFSAAIITFLFIFKMIGYNIKSSVKILWHRWFHSKGKTVHLFWGINEASFLLAEDIRKKHPSNTIIFININEEGKDNTLKKTTLSDITNTMTIKNNEIVRLNAIHALVDQCINGPATLTGINENDIFSSLLLKNIASIIQKSKKSYFYFLSDNEVQNISAALNLQRDKQLRSMNNNSPTIYVHARKDANNEVFDRFSLYSSDLQRLKIKIVDSAYLSVMTLKLDDKALPVNCVNIDKTTGLVNSPFTALIVGFGSTGQESFKFLYEFAAFISHNMQKSPFLCYAIDEKMNKIAGLVREKMPAITSKELSLIQASVDSEEFWAKIKTIICELNYVVITLNNDVAGLSLAVNLFKLALKYRYAKISTLKIMLRCYDNSNEKRMLEVVNNLKHSIENNNIEISIFGKEKDLYQCNTILSDAILTKAKEFNKVYEKSTLSAHEQWQKNFSKAEISKLIAEKNLSRYHAIYDINRRIEQNISNSLHCRTKMILMGFDKDESIDRLKFYYDYVNTRQEGSTIYHCNDAAAKLLRNIAMVEHERWIASHKLMGYTFNPQNDHVQKHHKYICPWKDLDTTTQSYDCNVVDTTIKLAYQKRKDSIKTKSNEKR